MVPLIKLGYGNLLGIPSLADGNSFHDAVGSELLEDLYGIEYHRLLSVVGLDTAHVMAIRGSKQVGEVL